MPNDPSNPPGSPLEQFTDAALRELPLRRAPATLEARVLAQIERQAVRSWWQLGYRDWPVLVRALFLLTSVAMGTLAVRATNWLVGQSSSALSGLESDLTPATTSVKATVGTFSALVHSVPSLWVYGAIVAIAAMYIALFGIGAAAYRTLYANR